MPRTTINLDAAVLRELRARGTRERKSAGELASELLARALASDEQGTPATPFRWISRDLGKPLVDLEDREAVRRALDER